MGRYFELDAGLHDPFPGRIRVIQGHYPGIAIEPGAGARDRCPREPTETPERYYW